MVTSQPILMSRKKKNYEFIKFQIWSHFIEEKNIIFDGEDTSQPLAEAINTCSTLERDYSVIWDHQNDISSGLRSV